MQKVYYSKNEVIHPPELIFAQDYVGKERLGAAVNGLDILVSGGMLDDTRHRAFFKPNGYNS